MRIKRLPNVLALHLKRFKYIEQLGVRLNYKPDPFTCMTACGMRGYSSTRTHSYFLQRFKKLSYKVAFPLELELDNIASDMPEPDRRYVAAPGCRPADPVQQTNTAPAWFAGIVCSR